MTVFCMQLLICGFSMNTADALEKTTVDYVNDADDVSKKVLSIDPRGTETYTITYDDGTSGFGFIRWIGTFRHYPNGMTKFVSMTYENHFSWEWPLCKVSSFRTEYPEGSDVTGLTRMLIYYTIHTGATEVNRGPFIFKF